MSRYKWNDEDLLKLSELRKNKVTIKEISKILNIPENRVRYASRDLIAERVHVHNKRAFDEQGLFSVKCHTCNSEKSSILDFRNAYIDGDYIRGTVECNDCIHRRDMLGRYRRNYGIILDWNLLLDTYDIIQWYKWTTSEKMPNGKILKMLPKSLITKENISIIGRYAINEVLNLKTREEILTLKHDDLIVNKIMFSDVEYILGSSLNLITVSFPELNIKGYEMDNVPSNYWSKRENFLDAIEFYYYKMKEKFPSLNVSHFFTKRAINDNYRPILTARDNYFKQEKWEILLKEIGITEKFMNNKYSYDEIKFSSIEEKDLYEFVHNHLNIKDFSYIGYKSNEYSYYDKNTNVTYFPDFYINRNNKTYIIEYFGMWKEQSNNPILQKYKERTINKIKFFSSLESIDFIAIFPKDLNKNYLGVIEKFKSNKIAN